MDTITNNELLELLSPDGEARQVKRLRAIIKAFKKYDRERKEFIQKLQYELEDISEQCLLLKQAMNKDTWEAIAPYKEEISKLKLKIRKLQLRIDNFERMKAMKNLDDEHWKEIKHFVETAGFKPLELVEKNIYLEKRVKDLINNDKILIAQLCELRRKYNENQSIRENCGMPPSNI